MSLTESALIWIVSFLIFLIILYISYKISYKLGIKKALYRTTYILLSIVFAFSITPYVNRELFSLDLTKFDITLKYKDQSFTTIIDYVEEVIAHSEFLNGLYVHFPSLKDLFMDFPQVVLAPITYVLLFLLFLIIWLPLYLYLSYRRKRRILYDREDNKTHRVWAGILGAVQAVFVISVILSPINGINRIYQRSIKNTLDEEYDSLCDGNVLLSEYKIYCDIVEAYDSTIFALIGDDNSISNYTFDALTRITYDGEQTNLSNEASLIIKSSIVLNQSGFLSLMATDDGIITMPLLAEKNFNEEDINIIIETLGQSKYSANLMVELEELIYNTLYAFSEQELGVNVEGVVQELTPEERLQEIKIFLEIIPLLMKDYLFNQILDMIDIIVHFVNEVPENRKDEEEIFRFINEVSNSVDLDNLELLCEYLFESKIFSSVLPRFIDKAFGHVGFNYVVTDGDALDQIYNVIDLAKLFKKYQPTAVLDFFTRLNDEEMMLVGEILNYLCASPESVNFVKFLLGLIFEDFDYYSNVDFLEIRDWSKEALVARDVCVIIDSIVKGKEIDFGLIKELWRNKDSQLVELMKKMLRTNSNILIKELVKSLDK